MPTCPFPLIQIDNKETVRFAMERLGLWDDGEAIEKVDRAGEGNMNIVARVVTNRRRLILKQSRPWVEKYPDIAAPAKRILAEIDFYRRVSAFERVSGWMPELIATDATLHLLAMEDLGEAGDYSDLYRARQPAAIPLRETTTWLADLHSISVDSGEANSIGNDDLRALNHAHIYSIPLQTPSAIPLDNVCEGLEDLAAEIRSNPRIHKSAERLGDRYLGTGDRLLHGDFYPGSWLRTNDGLRVIDPEFTFAGPAEFDLGVLAAHRILMGGTADSVDVVQRNYEAAGGSDMDKALLRGFAGMEVIRRLIGVAQLPLVANLAERAAMIRIATSLLESANFGS